MLILYPVIINNKIYRVMALFNNFRRGMDEGIVADGKATGIPIIIVFYLVNCVDVLAIIA